MGSRQAERRHGNSRTSPRDTRSVAQPVVPQPRIDRARTPAADVDRNPDISLVAVELHPTAPADLAPAERPATIQRRDAAAPAEARIGVPAESVMAESAVAESGFAEPGGPGREHARQDLSVQDPPKQHVPKSATPSPARDHHALPAQLLGAAEAVLGRDLSTVRVHPGSSSASALGAQAYTRGSEIHVAPGHFAPQTPAGRQLIGHELTHVAQQAAGRVRPTDRIGGMPLNRDPQLEREADRLGTQIAAAEPRGRRSGSGPAAPDTANAEPLIAVESPAPNSQRTRVPATAASPNAPIQRFPLVGNAVTDVLADLGGSLASTIFPVQAGSPRWGALNSGAGFGTFMEANLQPGFLGGGSATGGAPANPTWTALLRRRTNGGASFYVQGHLLNEHLGGPGNLWKNLTPLTQSANADHKNMAEEAIKLAANTPGNTVIYRVRPVYGSWPWDWPATVLRIVTSSAAAWVLGGAASELAELRAAEAYVPGSMVCDWWVTSNGQTRAHSVTISQRPPTTAVILRHGGVDVDYSRSMLIWNWAEASLVAAFKPYLMAQTVLPTVVYHSLATMTGQQLLRVVRALWSGNSVSFLYQHSLRGPVAVVRALVEAYGMANLSPLALAVNPLANEAMGGSTLTDPRETVFANRELRATLESAQPGEDHPRGQTRSGHQFANH